MSVLLSQVATTTCAPPEVSAGCPPYLDYDPAAYIVQQCSDCSDWHSAVVRDSWGSEVVREWHNPGCPTLLEWL